MDKLNLIYPNIIPPARDHTADINTGTWKYFQPRRVLKTSPCSGACPVGNDIQAALREIEAGYYLKAWRIFKRTNPLPAIMGRICHATCEQGCSRNELDQALSIRDLERLAGDMALSGLASRIKSIKVAGKVGKHVAVIGAGPAGLSAAYYLALRGVEVTLYDKAAEPGGLLVSAIPQFRLPIDVVQAEISSLLQSCGVRFIGGSGPGINMEPYEFRDKYDGLVVACGLGKPKVLGIKGESAKGVHHALEYLTKLKQGIGRVKVGRRVVVVGGGDVALDAARSALRAGAKEVTIVAPEPETNLAASDEARELAVEEGVKAVGLRAPTEILTRWGKVSGVKLAEVEWDRLGRMIIAGPAEVLKADSIIVAIGQVRGMDEALLHELSSLDAHGFPVSFAGELKLGPSTAANSMADGSLAGARIFSRLTGIKDPDWKTNEHLTISLEQSDFAALKGIIEPVPRIEGPYLAPAQRVRGFMEVSRAMHAYEASLEAGRCLHCGSCTSCDKCFVYCPDGAVKRDMKDLYAFDLDHCKGCGICAEECPSRVINMEPASNRCSRVVLPNMDKVECDERKPVMEVAS